MDNATTVIGLLHPGEMGAAAGRCLAGRGYEVLWASQGRGPETAARAAAAGLADAGSAAALAARAQVIISICPPHAALDVAWAVHGFRGLYVDANAVSPGTAREVARLICESGGRYVDGGIIGPPPAAAGDSRQSRDEPSAAKPGESTPGQPPWQGQPPYAAGDSRQSRDEPTAGAPEGTPRPGGPGGSPGQTQTRLYLSGADAAQVAALFDGTALAPRVIAGKVTAASAVKMAYAGWTKGTAALLLAVRALAREQGVEDALLAEWALSQPGLPARSEGAARSAVAKGWRWVGEMEEIGATMAAAGLPDGFHQAAAEIFRRSPRGTGPGGDAADVLDTVLAELTGDSAAL